ncbi:MAG TPA: hypothetical protein VKH40_11110 [Alloacidobacterium sp.]|nr:hypothetical protein [Alloacidobacterium sp.]
MILRLQSAISLLTCGCLITVASAASSNIGLVMTTGEVEIDGSRVPGPAAIFSGSLISSGDRSSNLQFSDGTSAVMKPGATVTVYAERSVLQRGVTMQRGVDKHFLLADGLRISGATPNAAVLVGVKDASYFEVAAQEGESDVWTSSGSLVARVEPGMTLNFALSQATATQENSVAVCGDLQQNYQLTDVHSNVTYQLQGSGLQALVGKSIRVNGTIVGGAPSGTTPQVIAVSTVKKLNHPCVMAAGAAPAAIGAITSRGGIAFLVFVAAGGILIGLGAAGSLGTSPSPVTPTTP